VKLSFSSELLVKRYAAKGFSFSEILSKASLKLLKVRTGKIGPKISSCITASSQLISCKIVGSM